MWTCLSDHCDGRVCCFWDWTSPSTRGQASRTKSHTRRTPHTNTHTHWNKHKWPWHDCGGIIAHGHMLGTENTPPPLHTPMHAHTNTLLGSTALNVYMAKKASFYSLLVILWPSLPCKSTLIHRQLFTPSHSLFICSFFHSRAPICLQGLFCMI